MIALRPLSALIVRASRRAALAFVLVLAPASGWAEPALWRITGGQAEIYLFGTVHLMEPDTDWQSADMLAAFDGADMLVLETQLEDEGRAAAAAVAQREGALPPGRTLTGLLDEDARARLDAAGARLGLPVAGLEPMRPWMASLVLALRFAQESGQAAEHGADLWLLERARARGAPVAHLEAPEDQIAVFATLSPQAELAMLDATLDEILTAPDRLDVLVRAWLDGDMETLAALTAEGMLAAAPELYEAALAGRNRNWAETLDAMTAWDSRIFVAVGAAHLAGPDSVQDLLRARGHHVERIR